MAKRFRIKRLTIAAVLFVVLVVIALFVRDPIVRPYLGDVLVVIFLHFLLRGLFRVGRLVSVLGVFALAVIIEGAQALRVIEWLHLADVPVARVVFGTTAEWRDVAMYGAGAILAYVLDQDR
ncbi:DUF2809 domain-containing protein [Parvularcula sp. LCG005]|uniref:ribosomal maturation YjgA family protein n=1 Tax=Parvularcula sp. LCG005 TaxID=3078805 RepID=UPI0029428386|nr:DUF2809 domain-containing protein [Parvularcula sp. LCG005]WOI54512.1 DUF2809 domain-containing protein [Parvularcula sp. LCG005]